VALLAKHDRLISVDLRGHGKSPRQPSYDLRTLTANIEETKIQDPFLIGHSLGGAVVTLMQSRATVNVDQ
jgi:pimeloyl-ACP methyl ester carboxylesterase